MDGIIRFLGITALVGVVLVPLAYVLSEYLARGALNKKHIGFWKLTCHCRTFLVLTIVLLVGLLAFAIHDETGWLDTTAGKILGASAVIGTLIAIVRKWIPKAAAEAYWSQVIHSLDRAIPRSGDLRATFNSRKPQMKNGGSSAITGLKVVLGLSEGSEMVIR